MLDKRFICHLNKGGKKHYWECRYRRMIGCPFKLETMVDENGKHRIKGSFALDTHTCTQDKVEVYKIMFRNRIKHAMRTDIGAKYRHVYQDAKKEILKEIVDVDLSEQVRIALPSYASLRSSAHQARCE